MSEEVEALARAAAGWLEAGHAAKVATVVDTWRSSPRPVGSQMVVCNDGRFVGSVSGGCVESAVLQAAAELGSDEPPRLLSFGVSSEQAWSVGLPCGGRIEVLLSNFPAVVAGAYQRARAERTAVVVGTALSGNIEVWSRHSLPASADLAAAVKRGLSSGESRWFGEGAERIFLHAVLPARRLILVGAAHLSQAVAQFAGPLGYAATVVDPRRAFATLERFPGVTLVHDWPDEAIPALSPDSSTAVVVLSHDAKIDEPALAAALRTDCFYIGALGSGRTQRARRDHLAAAGFDERSLARIHGPVGIDIGASTAAEIAIAILAEVIQVWRSRSG